MNKKGQYFIICAVILGILILGTAIHFNFTNSKATFNDITRTCDNYKNEIFEISQAGLSSTEELQEIQKITDKFIIEKNIQVLFIDGNSTEAAIQNNLSEYVLFTANKEDRLSPNSNQKIYGSNINITSPFNRIFHLTETRNFFSVIRMVKENEVYYC